MNLIPLGVTAFLNIFKGLFYSISVYFSDAKKKITLMQDITCSDNLTECKSN